MLTKSEETFYSTKNIWKCHKKYFSAFGNKFNLNVKGGSVEEDNNKKDKKRHAEEETWPMENLEEHIKEVKETKEESTSSKACGTGHEV